VPIGVIFSRVSSVEYDEQGWHVNVLYLQTLYIAPKWQQEQSQHGVFDDFRNFATCDFVCTLISIVKTRRAPLFCSKTKE
jgi:hypothetical protein